ncbi:MAG: ATP-binding protein [Dehalococcoidia bacterium]
MNLSQQQPAHSDPLRDLSFVSHELKTPLTIVKGYAALLRRNLDDELQKGMAAEIEQEADRLTRMINSLVEAVRLESGQIAVRPEPAALFELIDEVVSRHRDAEPDRAIYVELPEEELLCLVDLTSLPRVLDNLLANARAYSPLASPIEVSAAREDGRVRISVRDHGPGLSDEDRGRLGEKFFRGSATAGLKTLGLGLYIVRCYLERQDGLLEVESDSDGSVFHVLLPAA